MQTGYYCTEAMRRRLFIDNNFQKNIALMTEHYRIDYRKKLISNYFGGAAICPN
jgi:hypothetical protein